MSTRLFTEFYEWIQLVVSLVPGGLGHRVRRCFYRVFLASLGKGFKCGVHCRMQSRGAINIGENVVMNDSVWIAANESAGGAITVGNNVLIGPYVVLHSGNHVFSQRAALIREQGHVFGEIIIEDDVWLAAGVTVLAGVTVRKGTVAAAGTVITRDTETYGVYAGVPARLIKYRS